MKYDNLCKAKAIHDGKWIIGYYVCDECADKHYIFMATLIRKGVKEWIYHEIDKDTLCRHTGKFDIAGIGIYQGDYVESHDGDKTLALIMTVKYGTYEAYCPEDKCYMENVGFYVEAEGCKPMPLGPVSDYAKVIGNIFDNPEMLD